MIITATYIKSLKPCEDRLDNYLKYYSKFKGTLVQFLNLTKITHRDKLWVYFRSIEPKLIPLVAADFAEEVLHIYENKYPNDKRPREAIAAARNGDWAEAPLAYNAALAAAKAAFKGGAAYYSASAAAALAAASAKSNAADSKSNAAAAASSAISAQAAIEDDADAFKAAAAYRAAATIMEKKQISIMKGYLK